MNYKFDELTKGFAQSVTRRGALKKFGVGLAGAVMACLGLANNSHAGQARWPSGHQCTKNEQCFSNLCYNPDPENRKQHRICF